MCRRCLAQIRTYPLVSRYVHAYTPQMQRVLVVSRDSEVLRSVEAAARPDGRIVRAESSVDAALVAAPALWMLAPRAARRAG